MTVRFAIPPSAVRLIKRAQGDIWRGRWPTGVPEPRYIVAHGMTRAAARDNLQQRVEEFFAQQERPLGADSTMGELLGRWLEDKRPLIATGTWHGYEQLYRLCWMPAFGAIASRRFRPLDVQDMIRTMQAAGLSPKRIRDSLSALRQALRWLKSMGLIDENPLVDARLMVPKQVRHRVKRFTPAQLLAFLQAQGDDRFEPAWAFAASSGVRVPSELSGLRWTDLEGNRIRIKRSLRRMEDGDRIVELLKTDPSFRALVLPDFAMAALDRQRVQQARARSAAKVWSPSEYIFTNEIGGPLSHDVLWKGWRAALERAGLPPKSIRMYELRATAGTMLYHATKDLRLTQAYLGHSSASDMTFRHYVGADENDTVEAAIGIDRELAPILELPEADGAR